MDLRIAETHRSNAHRKSKTVALEITADQIEPRRIFNPKPVVIIHKLDVFKNSLRADNRIAEGIFNTQVFDFKVIVTR